ncbi:hypothetical protein [Mycobacterium intracellulare]|uniref:hypothetical protein n=1 Tax=Mycobacterium intracellulare TaxID=1767 RepID=UPI002ECED2AF|nr:hypothetical protein [Mycobacterium intracellulare]
MSRDALLPCFKCGMTLVNALAESDNQPHEGTEFRTYGHYGSTFWDSFHGEELVLNICDNCLREHADRLAQHKRFLPVTSPAVGMVGRQWMERPMVPYTGNTDDTGMRIDPEEIGTALPNTEWASNAASLREHAIRIEFGYPNGGAGTGNAGTH